MNCHSSNSHAGDLIWCLIALSKLPGQHTLRCNPSYHAELRGLVEGLPISIEDCSAIPNGSYNCWIASGQFPGVHYANDVDILGFVMRYFNALTSDAGFGPVFKSREDLLCDFPAITSNPPDFHGILVVNADPKSGQCPRYSSSEMDALVRRMEDKHPSVLSIEKAGLTLAQIGSLSVGAKLIVGCATGPLWPCMNRLNATVPRVILLDPMRLEYGPSVPIEHAANAAQAGAILERLGWL